MGGAALARVLHVAGCPLPSHCSPPIVVVHLPLSNHHPQITLTIAIAVAIAIAVFVAVAIVVDVAVAVAIAIAVAIAVGWIIFLDDPTYL